MNSSSYVNTNVQASRLATVAFAASIMLAAAVVFSTAVSSAEGTTSKPAGTDGALHVPSPDWRDQIIYSLMIDRFNDGDPSRNDQGKNVYDPKHGGFFSGGDLKGITNKVDYLKSLGVTAVWVSPPTATQWWDPITKYTGYHGYWPVDFMNIDKHFGSLEDYKTLSRTLHKNGMYLIQDAVVNQIGHYYNYAGGHHIEDNRINFHLNKGAIPPAPTMPPFDKINLLDPDHAAADIYHWTPSITDYSDPAQQYKHQLQLMNDINTSNPAVRSALKESYGYWIKEVGVDGFRLDAAKHVEFDFWEDFLHGKGGVSESAAVTGRQDFLTFGEIFDFSNPLQTNGEERISSFLGTPQRPLLKTVINFPLYVEIRRVLLGGLPTAYLAHRLRAQADYFPDPHISPNFVDNHDVERLLSSGTIEEYKQAYTLLLTVPGIPIIYQGTEQAFTEVRRAMFKGGYLAVSDAFDQTSDVFQFLKSLIEMRKAHASLRHGKLTVVAENNVGAGTIAFKRETEDEVIFVIINSSGLHATLLNVMPTELPANTPLQVLHVRNVTSAPILDSRGRLTMQLPPNAALVFKASPQPQTKMHASPTAPTISIEAGTRDRRLVSGDRVCGHISEPNAALKIIANGELSYARQSTADGDGKWCTDIPSTTLDQGDGFLEVYAPAHEVATLPLPYISKGNILYRAEISDQVGDHRGPKGTYTFLTDDPSHTATDIHAVNVRTNGDLLELVIKVGEIKNVWNYTNKFDHAAFAIFVDTPQVEGALALPGLNSVMPQRQTWEISHRLFGMSSAVHTSDNATASQFGRSLDIKPNISIEPETKTITIVYRRTALGIKSWAGVKFYIATWDANEFGIYRPIGEVASAGQFGGGNANSPRIFDDISFAMPQTLVLGPDTENSEAINQ